MQCDFDGTITIEDASFLLLDKFADGDWRQLLAEYQEGKISVGVFNTRAFAMVKAEKQAMLDFILRSQELKIRPGFQDLLSYCSSKGLEFAIISNGLKLYIEAILANMGLKNIKIFAADSLFKPEGMVVRFIGPDGNETPNGFKELYTKLFLSQGYRVIYVGNGISDIHSAKRAHHVFATADLLKMCRELNLACIPFADLHDVVRGLEHLPLN